MLLQNIAPLNHHAATIKFDDSDRVNKRSLVQGLGAACLVLMWNIAQLNHYATMIVIESV